MGLLGTRYRPGPRAASALRCHAVRSSYCLHGAKRWRPAPSFAERHLSQDLLVLELTGNLKSLIEINERLAHIVRRQLYLHPRVHLGEAPNNRLIDDLLEGTLLLPHRLLNQRLGFRLERDCRAH